MQPVSSRLSHLVTGAMLSGLLVVGALFSGCGSTEQEASELTAQQAQAALNAQRTIEALLPALQAQANLPEELVLPDELQVIKDRVQQRLAGLGSGLGCLTVESVEGGLLLGYIITLNECSVGQSQVDGQVTISWSSGQDAASANAMVRLDLQTEAGQSASIDLSGTVSADKASATVVLSADGTMAYDGQTFAMTVDEVAVRSDDKAPHAGSITVSYPDWVIEITFSANTVTDGLLAVSLNGHDLGEMTAEELLALLGS
jgi:hypothetical protein